MKHKDGTDISSTVNRGWAELRDSKAATEAAEHIEGCLFDIADPQASLKRKRNALAWLGYRRVISRLECPRTFWRWNTDPPRRR